MSKSYLDFLARKVAAAQSCGIDVDPAEIHPILKPAQAEVVVWAARGGRRALFERFGLGKTVQQLEIMRLHGERSDAPRLQVCPLGVRQEFVQDAADLLGMELRFIRRTEEVDGPGLYLTNYESIRDGRLDPSLFEAVSLDEASVLRSYGSKTFQTFLTLFDQVRYRYVATATPSPNRYKELIHYAGFLGVMDTGQALTRWFQRDSTKANHLTLYPHKREEFFLWLNTWAIFLQKPSDLGFDDTGYDLPPLEVVYHEVPSDIITSGFERDGQARFATGESLGVSDAARQKRSTLVARVGKMVELVAEAPEDHFVLWHDLEDERRAIKKAIPEAVEVYGSQELEEREKRIADFSAGRIRLLATKPILSGSGCNFQRHCHREIFLGVTFKFNDFIQAVHRVQRFLQTEKVRIDIIHSELERSVVQTLQEKWGRHEELTGKMSEIIRRYGLDTDQIIEQMARAMSVERQETAGEGWTMVQNDCVLETEQMEDCSVDEIVTSIPFSNHYEYTPSYLDFGHTDNNAHFWAQMDFLTPGLWRVLKPGRIYACHVKDRILFGNVTGAGLPQVSPFHAEAIMHGIKHGFDYLGMITVVTDVVRENNQTYRLGWSEMCKDGSKMGVGSPEYILLFHKPQSDRSRGYADVPVTKDKAEYGLASWQVDAHAFWRSSGDRHLTPEELAALPTNERVKRFTAQSVREVYSYDEHVQTGAILEAKNHLPATFMSLAPGSHHPDVWHDINRMLSLNGSQSQKGRALHVCPLQLDIVDRLIRRYSNPGELIFDPFGGLGTVPVRALHLGRRGLGVELNPDYWRDAVAYLRAKEAEVDVPTLFDALPSP